MPSLYDQVKHYLETELERLRAEREAFEDARARLLENPAPDNEEAERLQRTCETTNAEIRHKEFALAALANPVGTKRLSDMYLLELADTGVDGHREGKFLFAAYQKWAKKNPHASLKDFYAQVQLKCREGRYAWTVLCQKRGR